MFHDFNEAVSFIDSNSIEQVDLKFCDLWGRWHHVTVSAAGFNQELMDQGIGFDGSSVGFKSVSSGDMVMVPESQVLIISAQPSVKAPSS